jgi:GTP-binding protein
MIDCVEFEVVAGNGGDGIVSFRREKFSPLGGPDGGDGGRGGDVVFVADRRMSTLQQYRDQRIRAAGNGRPGGPNRMHGAAGEQLVITVPAGSVIWDLDAGDPDDDPTLTPFADLADPGSSILLARGGRGGRGNKRFATPTRQAPKFAQRGQSGQTRRLRIELKLIADVGLVGLPNAGKSTLLRSWSRATPKVAAYPFTTLEPELGVVDLGYDSFVAADMPGLIEGASEGVGLGHEFLRHIERTRVLVHVLDMSADDPLANRELINEELRDFGHGLADKPQLLALNKVDDPNARAHVELLTDQIEEIGLPWFVISAATGEGTRELSQRAYQVLSEFKAEAGEATEDEDLPVLRPAPTRARFEIESPEDGAPIIRGATPEWLAETLDLNEAEPRAEFFDRLSRLGVARALHRVGVGPGDLVRIGEVTVRWDGA